MRWIVLACVLLAAPVAAQTAPNRLDVVQRVTAEDPARFACAHTGRPCEADWIKAVASALHAVDPKFGLNGKRGNPNDLSLDVVTYRLGPTDRHVEAFDICGACGSSSARPVWSNITNYQTIGQPGTAVWVQPVGSPAPVPTPPPASSDVAALRAEIAALRAALLADIATLRANHDGIVAVATEARDKAAEAAERMGEIAAKLDALPAHPCLRGRVPKAFGGSTEVEFCPAP